MKRHPVDGAEILRRTLEMPPLAAVVAFEHHLRIDGTGLPGRRARAPSLNLATQLCSIADVYDAMRSQREYQQAFPTERILAVLKQNDGTRFDQHLVRRFTQLMGIYPPGNLVQARYRRARRRPADPRPGPGQAGGPRRRGPRRPSPVAARRHRALWRTTARRARRRASSRPVNPRGGRHRSRLPSWTPPRP